ncbi:AsnC family transcriptional regulator [Pyrodictium occultum]|uniref:AsnC family transcriptional regulator n=1 Tax=Pyrodictium occultum TaxID=2309 RepID=A0A0V8RUY4_PYROC|nr:HTH-type transcriptional regulator LysM [Pyrodictium occultum]KSW11857.1 AsnC family transcriptional regulator [Pyrodictium occultum]
MQGQQKPSIDEIDMKLLRLLRDNARMSYVRLAQELGLSESAVRKRITKLIKTGVIKKFTIVYDTGSEIRAFILVRTQPPVSVPEVSKKILSLDLVEAVYEVTGDYDILVMVRGEKIDDVNKCIDYIRSIPGVSGTNSMIVLRQWV